MFASFPRWLASMVALSASVGWALVAILGPGVLGGLLGGGASWVLVGWWQQWRRPDDREKRLVVGRALRGHRDPGPAWRDEVTSAARQRLARPASDRWAPGVLVAVLAAACLVAAVLRGNWTDALPAVPLLVLGAIIVRAVGQQLLDASRWLDHPPYAPGGQP